MTEGTREESENHHIVIAQIQKDVEYIKRDMNSLTNKIDIFTASFVTQSSYEEKQKNWTDRSEMEHEGIRTRIRKLEQIHEAMDVAHEADRKESKNRFRMMLTAIATSLALSIGSLVVEYLRNS